MGDALRLHDTFPLDRETVEEHLKTIQTQCDFFPLAASQAEQTIELLNIRRRASLAIAALHAGRLTPRQRTPEPTIVEALPMLRADQRVAEVKHLGLVEMACGELDGED